jgi:nucleotide-binding universal stress UspA family protein
MNTILVATDFSDASRNASVYGVNLARALNAKVLLFNTYKVATPAPALSVSVSGYDVMMQTDKRLLDEAAFLDPDSEMIDVSCDEGETADAIINIASEKKADLIIAGMKGKGKNIKKIFGSTATSLIKKSNIPVIIVPEEAQFTALRTILYATDREPDACGPQLDQITAITAAFDSTLYVLRLTDDENAAVYEKLHLAGKNSGESNQEDAFFQFPVGTDITQSLNKFIRKHHVDMVVMMPHKREWLERLFKKSETKDMIFHTHIPVLVIPE